MSSVPRVSVVIVSWNALPLLKQCLPSVTRTEYPELEIILADNASTDGSSEWVARTFPEVKIVRHPENWFFCKGNNAALPHATGTYVVLLNNDVEVPPDWLDPLVDLMEAQPDVAAAQPKLLQYDDRERFEYAGAAGGFIDRVGYPFTRGRIFDTMERDRGQYDDAREIFWATGAALFLRRSALDDVGLLDERFELHMEEIDLCWRLWRAGYRVMVEPASEVYHLGGSSLPKESPRKAYYNFRNSLLMLYKNLPPHLWRRVLPQRLSLDGIAAARAVLKGRFARADALRRAYADALHLHRHYINERPSDDEPLTYPRYRGLIAVDYFLRGRHHFSDLSAGRFSLPTAQRNPTPEASQ